MTDEYVASVLIYKNAKQILDIVGVVEQVYIQTETVEKNDGVIVWHEPTGLRRITLTIVEKNNED